MNDRQKVAQYITTTLSSRFKVVDNTGPDKKIVATQFPDILVFKKDSVTDKDSDLLFIMKIENGGELVDSVPQWKELAKIPTTFYIVVPQDKLEAAKKLVSVTGIKAKFASYLKNAKGEVTYTNYE